jgi:hypothetical protein
MRFARLELFLNASRNEVFSEKKSTFENFILVPAGYLELNDNLA